MTSGIIYARHSTKKQAESADDQIKIGLADFSAAGIDLAHPPFVDRARSGGKTIGRNGFLEMTEWVEKNRVDFVWIWSISRLAREFNAGMHFFTGIESRGAKLLPHVEKLMDGQMRGVHASFLFMAAEDQRIKNGTDTSRGYLSKIIDRGYWKGQVPLGYKLGPPILNGDRVNHKLVPDPKTRRLVQRAWKLRASGYSLPEVWQKTHIGRSWSGLQHMFHNPIYTGTLKYLDKLYPNYAEPLVDRQTWDKVQAMFRPAPKKGEAWAGRHPRQTGRYPLSGVLYCGLCGAKMVGNLSNRWRRYICKTRRDRHDCQMPYVGARELEQRVMGLVSQHISAPDVIPGYELWRSDWLAEQGGRATEIRHQRERLAELETAVKRILDAIEAGGDAPELRQRLKERREERRAVLSQITDLETQPDTAPPPPSPEVAQAAVNHIRQRLEKPDSETVRLVVRWIVERVDYTPEAVHLTVKRAWYASLQATT